MLSHFSCIYLDKCAPESFLLGFFKGGLLILMNALYGFLYYFGIIFIVAGLLFLGALLLRHLWNTTIPELFNLKPVTYWQAFRLLLIAILLFGVPNLIK